jgi:hypothetical protein
MPAPPIFFQNLTLLLERATSPTEYDELLDLWWDARTRASQWDADQWGLELDMTSWAGQSAPEGAGSDENGMA